MSSSSYRMKMYATMISISVVMGLMSGCGSTGTSGGGESTSQGAASAETEKGQTSESNSKASGGEVTELTYWSLFTGDDGATMDSIVQKFNDEHPDIHVTHMAMSATDDLYVKLPMVAGDNKQAPDIAVIWSTYIPYFVEKGTIQPVTEITEEYSNLDDSNFTSPELVYYKDKKYGTMLDFPSVTLWVNKDLVNKYDPEILDDDIVTWDEAFSIGDKIKAAGDSDKVKVLACDWDTNDIELGMLEQGANYSTDGTTFILTEDDLKKAISNYKKLNDNDYFMPEGSDAFGMFAQGSAVFCSGGTWSLNTVKDYPFAWEELPPIQVSPDKVITNAVAHTFVLPTQDYTDAEKKAIGTFESWFEDNAVLWAQAGSIVANKNVSEGDEFKKLPQYKASSLMTPEAPNYVYLSICEDTIHKYSWQPVYGEMSVDDWATAVISDIKSKVAAQ